MKHTMWIILGLLVVLGGVGGVEHSMTTTDLISSTAVSVLGCIMMWIGTAGINDDSGRYHNYSTRR
jgi:dethiobiotin synthetase